MLIDFHAHAFLDKLAAGAVSSLAASAHLKPFTDGTVKGTQELMAQQGVDRFVVLNIAVSPRTEQHVNDLQYPCWEKRILFRSGLCIPIRKML